MTGIMLALSGGRSTNDPLAVRVLAAQRINRLLGGAVVGPWDVDEIPDDLMEVMTAMTDKLPAMESGRQQIEAKLAQWRAGHKKGR